MKKIFFNILLLCPFILSAAAPLTHLVIGEKFLEHFNISSEEDKRAFLLGNVFPDVRYIGDVTRERTHETGLTLEDVLQSSSPFKSGMRLHAYVDEVREDLVVKWNIYESLLELGGDHLATLLKLIEDEILYDQTNVEYLIPLFYEILDDEINFGISVETDQKWHFFLIGYLSNKPSDNLKILAGMNRSMLNIPPPIVKAWSEKLEALAAQDNFNSYVRDLIEHFSTSFNNHPQERH